MADMQPMDVARFWSRVDIATDFQCWEWKGARDAKGYGIYKGTRSHRVSYTMVNGKIPDGLLIRHRCDNPPCCNPKHLEVGTHADNTNDAVVRGRIARGSRHGNTKLSDEDVAFIRANPFKEKQIALARRFGVTPSAVSYIRSGRSWKVVGGEGLEPPTTSVSS